MPPMLRTVLHPGFRHLSLYADGDLDAPARRRVDAHLERCARCRATVVRVRQMDAEARALPAAPLPADLRARVLTRHGAGETVILPLTDSPVHESARRRGWIAAAAAAVLALVGAPLVLPRAELEANRSDLVFSPAAPRLGATVQVAYRGGALLAGEERLRLRARYLAHDGLPVNGLGRQAVVAELVRGRDGVFRGAFQLPDSVVYAAFAVEDGAGARVDSNGRKLWELLAHGPDGRPRFEALAQRQFDHMEGKWEQAQENARQAAALYPDRVDAWFNLFFIERASFTGPAADSALARARARLAEFDRAYRARASLDVESELGIITRLADEVGDTARYRHWRARLLRTAPNTLWGVQERFYDIAGVAERDPRAALAGFDSLWSQVGLGRGAIVYLPVALSLAESTGDAEEIRRWAGRYLRYAPEDEGVVGAALARHPALREEGMERLRARIRALERVDDTVRPLERAVTEERRARAEEAQRVLADLGAALLAAGRRGAALDTLERATRTGWDAALFRLVAELRLQGGDTAGAAVPLALAAADPLLGAALGDSARLVLGSRFDAAGWRARVEGARREMRERVLAHATRRRLPERVRLRTADGRTVTLREISGGRPTFVAFWYRYCPPSREQIPQLQRIAAVLQREGYTVITLTEPLTPEFRRYLGEQRITLPIYADPWKELEQALDQTGTPNYFVLDGAGNLRFGTLRELTAVPAQMAALAEAGGASASRSRPRQMSLEGSAAPLVLHGGR
jgi:thiol-disulfide isomerase/thioredoxin